VSEALLDELLWVRLGGQDLAEGALQLCFNDETFLVDLMLFDDTETLHEDLCTVSLRHVCFEAGKVGVLILRLHRF